MGDVLLVGVGLTAATALKSLTTKCRVVGLLRRSDPADTPDEAIALARSRGIPIFEDTTLPALPKPSSTCVRSVSSSRRSIGLFPPICWRECRSSTSTTRRCRSIAVAPT